MKKDNNAPINHVKLELLRNGPAHNQLLSPLTPYIALCGADGPVTVRIPFEHRQLLTRLRRLRYPSEKDPADDEQRQAEVRDIGEAIGSVFGQVPALLTELGHACAEKDKLIHLQLALSGFELGMLPFEAAVAPDGFPGSGSPLFLQMRTPISITREIRRGQPLPVEWNRAPKILFAFAAPDGLYVPARAHLQALREAIEPWINIKDNPEDRLPDVKKLLTVLPNASLEKIRKECSANEYTHVHILAHGASFKNSGEDHYGVALCNEHDLTKDIVDGERLAIALTTRDATGRTRFRPTVVTLATCDSGTIESVVTPGGSIAHELNATGIPWVIASQFPLWMKASAIAAEVLYHGLLSGKDPRWALYDLRQRLRTDSPGTHDWASIVAYSTIPPDFEEQVNTFRHKQTLSKVEVKFARMDELLGVNSNGELSKVINELEPKRKCELNKLRDSIREDLKKWRAELDSSSSSREIAERFGVSAASEKRIGIAYFLAKEETDSKKAYETSRDFYRTAWEKEPSNHWAITQHLSSLAILTTVENDLEAEKALLQYNKIWIAAQQIADWSCRNATGKDRIWAFSTLAELNLLSSVYGEPKDLEKARAEIKRCCMKIRELVDGDEFPLFSTKRQFRRYINYWCRHEWNELAKDALRALGEKLT